MLDLQDMCTTLHNQVWGIDCVTSQATVPSLSRKSTH